MRHANQLFTLSHLGAVSLSLSDFDDLPLVTAVQLHVLAEASCKGKT